LNVTEYYTYFLICIYIYIYVCVCVYVCMIIPDDIIVQTEAC